MKVSSNTKSTE